jgi:hypothetical protein
METLILAKEGRDKRAYEDFKDKQQISLNLKMLRISISRSRRHGH